MASLLFFSFFLLVWFLVLILYLTLSPPLISSVSLSCNSSLLFFPSIVGINTAHFCYAMRVPMGRHGMLVIRLTR